MRTLLTFGPAFGMPDPSPFCCKAMVLLRMAGVAYEAKVGDVRKAPKGKFPVLVESDGREIPDTSFIRMHLEDAHGADFDAGLSAAEKGIAWAFEKLSESDLYFAIVHERWVVDDNFNAGPRIFFEAVPMPMRPVIVAMVKRSVKKNLHGQGMGRHTRGEICQLARRGFDAVSAKLGDKPWLMGDAPCGADASVWAMVASAAVDRFDSEITRHVRGTPNLMAYRDRGMAEWFPEFANAG